jgi:hypothetical protein
MRIIFVVKTQMIAYFVRQYRCKCLYFLYSVDGQEVARGRNTKTECVSPGE